MRIDQLRAGARGGLIGFSRCPGKRGEPVDPQTQRHLLERDIQVVKAWRARALVSALEDEELRAFGVSDLGACATRASVWWFRIPLKEASKPDGRFWRAWPQAAPSLLEILRKGERVVIHSCG